jgi:hypothetical protein
MKINGNIRKVKILDSYCVLPSCLRKLCKDYKVEVSKGYFPYKFSSEKTLFYIGKTPDISYYNNIPIDMYKHLESEN